ncbi:MAG: tetratricopeptide repeat protein [Candidatus Firestonebacteria bacterium]
MIRKIIIICLFFSVILNADEKTEREDQFPLTEKTQYQVVSKLFVENDDKKNAYYEYKKFLKLFPYSDKAFKAQYMLGECLFIEAIKTFSNKSIKELSIIPKESEGLVILKEEEPFIPTFDKAIEEYIKVIQNYPKNELFDDAHFRISECYYNKGDYDKAISWFRHLITNYPDSFLKAESMSSLALCYLVQEMWDEANEVFQQLVSMYPAYSKEEKVLFGLGLINFYKKDYEYALDCLKRVKSPEGYYYAGRCFDKLGKNFSAVVNYRKVIVEYPKSDYVEKSSFSIPESFYLSTDYFSAISSFQKFIDNFPESSYKPYAAYKVGCSYFLQKNYTEAIKVFEDCNKNYPGSEISPLCMYLTGESLRNMNKVSEANVIYGQAVLQYFNSEVSPYSQYKIGWCYYTQENSMMAIGAYEQFDKDFSKHDLRPYSYFLTANSFYKLKKFDKASYYYGLICDRMPNTSLYEVSLCMLNSSEYEQRNYDQIVTNYHFIVNNLKPTDNPWRAKAYLFVADAYFRYGLYKDADAVYNMIKEYFPKSEESVESQFGLSWVANAQGKFDVAEKETRKVLEHFEGEETKGKLVAQSEYEVANNLFNQKKYVEALDIYEKFVKDNPDDSNTPEAIYRSGLCYYRLEYYSSAIKAWESLVNKFKNHKKAPESLYQIADTYFRAQKYQEAIASYHRLINEYPDSEFVKESKLRIAQSYYNAKDDDQAIKEFKKYIETYSDDPQISDVIESIESSSKRKLELAKAQTTSTSGTTITSVSAQTVTESIDTLKGILEKYPKTKIAGEIQYKIGKKYFDDKIYDKALEELTRVIINYPESPSVSLTQFFIGESYYKLGKYEEALSSYNRFVSNFSENEFVVDALFHSATSNYNLKKYEDAANSYKEIIKKFPSSEFTSAAVFNMALAYKKANKLDDSASTYLDFYNKYPNDANAFPALIEVGNIYQKQKRYNAAIDIYRKIPIKSGDEQSVEIQYQIGDSLIKVGKNDGAEQEFVKLINLQPLNNAWRLTGLAKLAEMYENKNKLDEAVKTYNDIIANSGKEEWTNAAKMRIEAIKQLQIQK